MTIVEYFLAFIIYSFIGWIYESLLYTLQEKRFISSGFLFGPCCPIYGGGAVIMVFCFYGRTENPFILFFGGMLLSTAVEYSTAVILESVFHKKWWDYSNIKFNFQGRICLLASLCFGTMCLLLCKAVQPLFNSLINLASSDVQLWIAVVLLVVLVGDIVATTVYLKIKMKSTMETENCENELPPLDIQALFSYIGIKGKFKIKLKIGDRVHFGGIGYIIEKLKIKPLYYEKAKPFYNKHIEPIKEKIHDKL